ncbi:MAG TPA: hypothetical protein VFV15_01770 [Moraxellaceae bacterium]|nr:hypothetical protein [Moraxellaceae bacterium]
MAYAIAWGVYLLTAALLQFGYERYVAEFITRRRLRIGLRALLAIVLFTPGVVASTEGVFVVPACIGVLFNVLAHSGPGLVKALLPLLFATAAVFGLLFLLEHRRAPAAPAGDEA